MLQSCYQRLLKIAEWRLSKGPSAYFELSRAVMQQGLASFRGEHPVLWATIYSLPMEVITAMDLAPFNHEMAAAMLAVVGQGVVALQAAEDNLFSRDSCSYQRAGLGAGLDGHLPHPIALVGTTHICDGVGKVYAHIGRRYGLEPILVDVPYQYSQEGVSHLEKQLWDVIDRLSEAKGEPFDQDKLVEVVRRSNRIRERMLRVSELRKLSPSPWHGREPFDFTFLSYMIWGTEELLTIYDHLIEQLEDRVANPPPRKERSRILWLHAMPYHKTKLMHLLEEEHGAHIVFEELSTVYWEEIDERNPVRSLAEKMLRWPGAGPVENRVQNALRLAKEYRVDGAIHFSHWGCRQGCGGVRVLKDSLMELDVPLLNLDGDGIDSRTYSPGQEKTRVEGFLEMLG